MMPLAVAVTVLVPQSKGCWQFLKEKGICVGKLWVRFSIRNAMSAFRQILNVQVGLLL